MYSLETIKWLNEEKKAKKEHCLRRVEKTNDVGKLKEMLRQIIEELYK